ncbi:hypothetical protein K466DRAFT_395063 [Polyporus arcularius HHB13444]|uniref:Uncharacterized protein n=1 Tax=Polyporus arcularius HHB13444 TaxID=1314778 RepID=A0A5C3PL42_9APHY|nr:hypothetical protein K466DRAFT_395063 [Polyporus arcularius HHB13444]
MSTFVNNHSTSQHRRRSFEAAYDSKQPAAPFATALLKHGRAISPGTYLYLHQLVLFAQQRAGNFPLPGPTLRSFSTATFCHKADHTARRPKGNSICKLEKSSRSTVKPLTLNPVSLHGRPSERLLLLRELALAPCLPACRSVRQHPKGDIRVRDPHASPQPGAVYEAFSRL